jgi:putative FmdB family regulatory protein
MPLYEYQCDACGVRFERVQRVTDDPARVCPECGGQVHRLFQPVGIIFKGSGFYVTDNRAKAPSSGSGSSGSSGSSSGSSSSDGASKPAAKSESGSSSGSGSSESKSTSSSGSSSDKK